MRLKQAPLKEEKRREERRARERKITGDCSRIGYNRARN